MVTWVQQPSWPCRNFWRSGAAIRAPWILVWVSRQWQLCKDFWLCSQRFWSWSQPGRRKRLPQRAPQASQAPAAPKNQHPRPRGRRVLIPRCARKWRRWPRWKPGCSEMAVWLPSEPETDRTALEKHITHGKWITTSHVTFKPACRTSPLPDLVALPNFLPSVASTCGIQEQN